MGDVSLCRTYNGAMCRFHASLRIEVLLFILVCVFRTHNNKFLLIWFSFVQESSNLEFIFSFEFAMMFSTDV